MSQQLVAQALSDVVLWTKGEKQLDDQALTVDSYERIEVSKPQLAVDGGNWNTSCVG